MMPYYAAGDYYGRGDYYRGDPGFLGNLFKGVTRFVGGVTGLGAIAKTGTALVQSFGPRPPMIAPPSGFGFGPELGQSTALGFPSVAVGGPLAGVGIRPAAMCIVGSGRRLNKSTYVTRGGGTSAWPRQLLIHPKGTECVKTRRMNVANPRALRRSIRRARGFVKLARRAASAIGFKVVSKGAGARKKK